ncbi:MULTISPECIES: nuclear transport factor 2 family protein [unclassified Streptomyces]|uniref:nuclear transport factor 2 family protein n=1 Tax=unclassified Streptomyces TaxID=2593676 RepID=UPI002E16E7A2
MALAPTDRTAITELLSLHGHLIDSGELDRLDELFTPDVVYDASDFGQPPLHGPAAIKDAALRGADGWRIARRKIIARRVPLGGR